MIKWIFDFKLKVYLRYIIEKFGEVCLLPRHVLSLLFLPLGDDFDIDVQVRHCVLVILLGIFGIFQSKLLIFPCSPAEYEVRLMGARSRRYQRISQSAVMRLFKPTGRLERRLKRVYIRSRSRRIPDVKARNQRRNNRRNRNRNASEKEVSDGPNSE